MPNSLCTFLRRGFLAVAALLVLPIAMDAQVSESLTAGPVITLAKSGNGQSGKTQTQTPAASAGFVGSPEIQAIRENYREFAAANVSSGTKISQASAPETFSFEFHGSTKLSAIKVSGDFRVTGGTCIEGHTYVAGAICNVDVAFEPKGPGHRTGQLALTHSAAVTPFLTPLGGTAYAPAISFIPSVIQTVPGTYVGSGSSVGGTLLDAKGLAIDGGDSLYIADKGNALIKKRDSSGVITTIIGGGTTSLTTSNGFGPNIKLSAPYGIAVDYSGTVYATDFADKLLLSYYADNIAVRSVGGGTTSVTACSVTSKCSPGSVALTPPTNLAVDTSGNLYMSLVYGSSLPGASIAEYTPLGIPSQFYGLNTTAYNYYSSSFAVGVDPFGYGNLYYTYDDPGGSVLSPTPLCYILGQNYAYSNGGSGLRFWTVAGSGACGFSGDGGSAAGARIGGQIGSFAWDPAGNFYFTDTANNRVRRVDGSNGVIRTVAGNGAVGYNGDNGPSNSAAIEKPWGLAVDSTGQVYTTGIANSSQTSGTGLKTDIRAFGTVGSLNFGTIAVGSRSAVQTVVLSNVGNSSLNFTHFGFSAGNPSDYTIDPNTTSCNFTVPLASGKSCNVGVIFNPTASGARSATYAMQEDTAVGVHLIQVTGAGATTVTLIPATMTFPSTTLGTQSSAIVATLTNTGKAALALAGAPTFSGTNATSFTQTTTCGTTLAVAASCTISVKFAPTAAGNLTASLVIKDNATSTQQVVSLKGTAVAAAAKPALSPTAQVFPAQKVSTLSPVKTIKLSNMGTAAMTISAYALTGTNAADFSYTKNCGTSVAAGAYCSINVSFKPTAAGTRTALLAVTTSAGKVTVALSGTATAAAAIKSTVSLSSKAGTVMVGDPVMLTSSVAAASGAKPTGKVQVKEGSKVLAEAALSNGVATLKVMNLSSGSHMLNAVYVGDSTHTAATSAAVQQAVVRPIQRPHVVR